MQTLDVISVNIWQIVISLANLLILFLILKKFLYKPVRNTLDKRQQEVDEVYSLAKDVLDQANADREAYEKKLLGADEECDELIREAQQSARQRSSGIIAEAEDKAAGIMRRAENEIELAKSEAESSMKKEIAELSVRLAEKLLEREISSSDHKALIDSFISDIGAEGNGEDNVGNRH